MSGYRKETRVTRLFIGKGEFADQDQHARSCEQDGWYVAQDVHDPAYHTAMRDVDNAIVVLHGADADACIPFGAAHAIAKGAKRVVIPLTHVRTKGETHQPLHKRALKLLRTFTIFQTSEEDLEKLTVTPTRVWNAVKKRAGK
ncbi:MAG: hypothetical protein ACOY3M_01905 [Patescibacteria group bacterium]